MCVRMFDRSLICLRYVKMNGFFLRHIPIIIHHLTSLLIPRLSITALAVDNARGYVLVAVNDRQRHVHVVDLYNEVRLLQLMPPLMLLGVGLL
jgi:hypothetical protein